MAVILPILQRTFNTCNKVLYGMEGDVPEEEYVVPLGKADIKKEGAEVGDFPYSINGLAMARGEMAGAVKVVTYAKFGAILGVHIVGQNATELVGEAVMVMQLEATVNELANSIRVHPTISDNVTPYPPGKRLRP